MSGLIIDLLIYNSVNYLQYLIQTGMIGF